MRITVTTHVDVEQVDDLTALSVATDLPLGDVDAHLRAAGLGRATDEHVWIEAEPLQSAASALSTAADWNDGFARMLDYARSKGWVDDTGAIRAHVTPLR
ncbi:hypothetical protein ACSS7Z_08230 [Microbacterium sp. A82]|uniref:hypothetical protein n=1 Tax=Microbacterium sp. A82 TaxID=3450452 RepID=UPI003F3E08A6